MNRTILVTLVSICFLAALSFAASKQNLRKDVSYLADDACEGRGIGTKGLDDAAEYIAAQFQKAGCEPAFEGSYFQHFEMGWGVQLGANNKIQVGEQIVDTSSGIMPYGFSSAGEVKGQVIFAGYGISAPEYSYDDFTDLDVNGAIVLCMSGEPGEFDSASVFEGVDYTAHATLRSKASNAKFQGAAALIIVEGPRFATSAEEKLRVPAADEPYMDCGIPALRITRAALSKLFPEFELGKLQQSIDSNTEPRSLTVAEDTVTVVTDLTRDSVPVKNVGCVIPGNDKILVLGAHYDHLGYGQSGSLDEHKNVIHNGADDNASGTSAIIEAARMLKKKPVQSTVVIVAFTAEETGLGGSNYLVKHFPLDINNVRAMVNLDMVGRVHDNKLSVLGCKSAEEFPDIVVRANQKVKLDITCTGDGYGPSDHMSFYLADKPVLFLFSGAHEDYHRSTDDVPLLNVPGMQKSTDLAVNIIRELDSFEPLLTFVKSAEPPSQGAGRFRVYFGSIPDYAQADTLIGVLLSGAREGGPAALAGIKGGDLLVRMGKVKLNNIYDMVFALRTYAPGDTVEIAYIREGKELTTQAVLQEPRQ